MSQVGRRRDQSGRFSSNGRTSRARSTTRSLINSASDASLELITHLNEVAEGQQGHRVSSRSRSRSRSPSRRSASPRRRSASSSRSLLGNTSDSSLRLITHLNEVAESRALSPRSRASSSRSSARSSTTRSTTTPRSGINIDLVEESNLRSPFRINLNGSRSNRSMSSLAKSQPSSRSGLMNGSRDIHLTLLDDRSQSRRDIQSMRERLSSASSQRQSLTSRSTSLPGRRLGSLSGSAEVLPCRTWTGCFYSSIARDARNRDLRVGGGIESSHAILHVTKRNYPAVHAALESDPDAWMRHPEVADLVRSYYVSRK